MEVEWDYGVGDITHRIDYGDFLNEDSIVVDCGGYVGQWASDIYSMYNCYVDIFEPVKSKFDFIKNRFRFNEKISVNNCGVWITKCKLSMSVNGEGSSFLINSDEGIAQDVDVINFNEYILNKCVVDLVKLNIEGAEYGLLEGVTDEVMNNVKCWQIQFHDFSSYCSERRDEIRERLSKRYKQIYNFPFVWESWIWI